MEELIEVLSHWSDPEFLARYRNYLVLTVFLYSFLEVIFPPLPGDSLLILSGSISDLSGVNPLAVMISASVGTFASSVLLYSFGAKMGKKLLQSPKYSHLMSSKSFQKFETWFQRYGFCTILLSRFIPIVRSGIVLAAGMVNLNRGKTFLTVGISIILSTTFFVMSGRFLGRNWRRLPEMWHYRIKMLFLILLCLMILFFILNRLVKMVKMIRFEKRKTQEQNE